MLIVQLAKIVAVVNIAPVAEPVVFAPADPMLLHMVLLQILPVLHQATLLPMMSSVEQQQKKEHVAAGRPVQEDTAGSMVDDTYARNVKSNTSQTSKSNIMVTATTTGNEIFMEDIEQLDFSMIKLKLQDTEEGQGWNADQCDETEIEYKKYLALKRQYPEKDIVPNRFVDIFWHQHILDTAKYAEDCENIFGYFLHHFPYFGMNGEEDAKNLYNAFEETKSLYTLHFNSDYLGAATRCKAPKCRTQCKPMKCR